MSLPAPAVVDPWLLEIITVVARSATDRRTISRDVERGLLLRLVRGGYVERSGFESLSPEAQHIVRMRALTAVSPAPVLFSHWSAGVVQGLPVLRSRLDRLHITVEDDDERHQTGIVAHLFRVDDAVVRFRELLVTEVGRTVVDIAGSSPFDEGVMAADAALHAGVPRELLELAVDLAGERRASRRIADVVAFADAGAESAAESRARASLMRTGIEVPVLQRPMRLRDGSEVFLDAWLPTADVGIEVDGEQKYLDAELAPTGAGRAVIKEKRREDEIRLGLRALVRVGWVQSGNPAAMRAVLSRVGVRPTRPRTAFQAYCDGSRGSRPRVLPRAPVWRTRLMGR